MRRRRSYAQRVLREELWAFLKDLPWQVTVVFTVLLVAAGATTILYVFIGQTYMAGLIMGFAVAAIPTTLIFAFLVTTDAIYRIRGQWGEDSTNDELRRAAKSKLIWGFASNVETEFGDVDHVVVAPRCILAIETKYVHASPRARSVIAGFVRQAKRNASDLQAIIYDLVGHHYDVVPLVVVWGRQHKSMSDEGLVMHGVRVIPGRSLVARLSGVQLGRVSEDNAQNLLRRLSRHRAAPRGT